MFPRVPLPHGNGSLDPNSSSSGSDVHGSGSDAAAMAWLLSFADPQRGVGWNARSSDSPIWKLGRTSSLLDLLGRPDRSLVVMTIAGTNGKGSTGAILASVAAANGFLVGHFAQPHLHLFRERIQIGGQPITAQLFNILIARLQSAVTTFCIENPDAGEPTAFELSVVLGILAFADARVDLATMEIGLGGRLDPVNVLDPVATVITSIGYDHIGILGHTLGEIAREKAGVMRPGRQTFSAIQRPSAARALRQAAREIGATIRFVPPLHPDPDATRQCGIDTFDRVQSVLLPDGAVARLGLLGDHQRQNAALVLAVWDVLLPLLKQSGPETVDRPGDRSLVDRDHTLALQRGLANVHWPGRLEWVAGSPAFLLDGAHNPAGAAALAGSVAALVGPEGHHLIFGCARDKDVAAVLGPLLRSARTVYTTAAPDTRAASPEELVKVARRLGRNAVALPSIVDAITSAQASSDRTTPVLVAGSLALVAAARVALGVVPPAETTESVRD